MATKLIRNLSNGKVQEVPASRVIPAGYELVAIAPCKQIVGDKVLDMKGNVKTREDFGVGTVNEEAAEETHATEPPFRSKFSTDFLGKEDE